MRYQGIFDIDNPRSLTVANARQFYADLVDAVTKTSDITSTELSPLMMQALKRGEWLESEARSGRLNIYGSQKVRKFVALFIENADRFLGDVRELVGKHAREVVRASGSGSNSDDSEVNAHQWPTNIIFMAI